MTGTSWNHQVALPTEGVSAGEARLFVRSRLVEHGLTILAQISEEWGVRREPDGSKSVWATFRTQRLSGAASRECDIPGPAGSY